MIDKVTLRSNTSELRLFDNKIPSKCKLFQIIAVTKKTILFAKLNLFPKRIFLFL